MKNHLHSSNDDDGCSMFDSIDKTPHCIHRGDASSLPLPPPLPKKIVSPVTTTYRRSVSLLVEQEHELRTFTNTINGKIGMLPSPDEGDVDIEIVDLLHHSSSGMPMFPLSPFDDIEDEDVLRESSSPTIYLQPRVPIFGCKIPPIASSSRQQEQYYCDHHHHHHISPTRNTQHERGGVPTTCHDLGLLPMVLSSDDHIFWNETNGTSPLR